MASSGNLASIDPWTCRTSFADSWISEALQKSISCTLSNNDSPSPLLNLINTSTSQVPENSSISSASNFSASDLELPPKRQWTTIFPPATTGKVSKRKSRASKRSNTTFITADLANFRQMVQQVTGVRFENAQLSLTPIMKPEPQRADTGLLNAAGSLPTLDSSAFLLDHQQRPSTSGSTLVPFQPSAAGEGIAAAIAGAAFGCNTIPCFPTLESWKV